MNKKIILIGIAALVVAAIAYAAWYSYDRHEKLVQSQQCNDMLLNPPKPTMVAGPDGNPAPVYSLNGCATVVVPPSLWSVLRGRMEFENVPRRMKVNPYSFADILLGRYTFGPTDIGCDQSATTTDCSTIVLQNPPQSQEMLARLQTDLRAIEPHFIDADRMNAQSLTPEESEIKDDLIGLFITEHRDDEDNYNTLWINAIGKRYILASKPVAETSYDEIIDSQTGAVTRIPGEARYYLAPEGRDVALYIDNQAIRTYTLDQGDAVLVPGSQLSGTETYHSGTSDAYLVPEQTHTKNSITISVFDSSQIVQNPDTLSQPTALQTMNKKVRDVTLSF
jgi:hypothetical protein